MIRESKTVIFYRNQCCLFFILFFSKLKMFVYTVKKNFITLLVHVNKSRTCSISVSVKLKSFLVSAAAAGPMVGFHAFYLTHPRPSSGSPLKFYYVKFNHGQGYNWETGKFTAPIGGLYFFIADTGAWDANDGAVHRLMVDSDFISWGYSYGKGYPNVQVSSAPGVVHLAKGQTVWVWADGSNYVRDESAVFCGFLISPDM
jgi:hypothetical protein